MNVNKIIEYAEFNYKNELSNVLKKLIGTPFNEKSIKEDINTLAPSEKHHFITRRDSEIWGEFIIDGKEYTYIPFTIYADKGIIIDAFID